MLILLAFKFNSLHASTKSIKGNFFSASFVNSILFSPNILSYIMLLDTQVDNPPISPPKIVPTPGNIYEPTIAPNIVPYILTPVVIEFLHIA